MIIACPSLESNLFRKDSSKNCQIWIDIPASLPYDGNRIFLRRAGDCLKPPPAPAGKDHIMPVTLGIDIGGSTTKIVGLREDRTIQSMRRVRAEDPVTSLFGALGNYLSGNNLALEDIRRIVLTGVGASYVEGDIYKLPTRRADEFTASGIGALALSEQASGVVVTMGTGTAFLWAEQGRGVEHLCGSGIGGGTLGGLCHRLVGMERFGQIKKLACGGDLGHVDLTIKDISKNAASTLDPNMTAANFGNLAEDATPSDIAAGAVNLVLQAIGTMTVLACRCCGSKTVILTGSMTTLEQAEPTFRQFETLYGLKYIIPQNATFATAIGAALSTMED